MTAAQFMTMAMQSDAFEMQSAQLAAQRAQDAAVKTYAQKMLADHGKTSAAMMQMRGETTASTGKAAMAPWRRLTRSMLR